MAASSVSLTQAANLLADLRWPKTRGMWFLPEELKACAKGSNGGCANDPHGHGTAKQGDSCCSGLQAQSFLEAETNWVSLFMLDFMLLLEELAMDKNVVMYISSSRSYDLASQVTKTPNLKSTRHQICG